MKTQDSPPKMVGHHNLKINERAAQLKGGLIANWRPCSLTAVLILNYAALKIELWSSAVAAKLCHHDFNQGNPRLHI